MVNHFSFHIFIIIATVNFTLVSSYNVLAVFPTHTFSHQQSCKGFSKALANRGHNVTVITAKPDKEITPNHHEIDVSFLAGVFFDYLEKYGFSFQTRTSPLTMLPSLAGLFANTCDVMFASEQLQRLLKSNNTKFDLIIYEGLYPCSLGLLHHYNYPPSVVIFTIPQYLPVHFSLGNPINPAYVTSFSTGLSDRMSFYERLKNTFYLLHELYVHEFYMYYPQDKIIKKYFGEEVPWTRDLERNNSLLLLSGDLSQGYPMPLQPNTLTVGTMHVATNLQPLNNDIKEWMDGATDGVIYFSLGSNMKGTSLEEEKREVFIKVFSKLQNYRIVWKWESDTEFPGKPANVLLKKWLPQQSVLAHAKTKLFISHCGHQSRQESIHYGVPVLGIPLFWDQDWNCKKLETNGAGMTLDFNQITYEDVSRKLESMLNNQSFRKNMQWLSMISKDKPMPSEDVAAWWMEYVIRHKGAPHLRPAVQNLYWFQYMLLDITIFVIATTLVLCYILYYILRKCISHKPYIKNKLKKT